MAGKSGLKFDDTQFKEFESDLERFSKFAVPIANQSMLNKSAFHAQEVMRDNIAGDMVNRNAWTKRSVQVEKAKGLNIRNQMSAVGSVADYMEKQEFGGVTDGSGTYQTIIPTSWAARQEGARPRTKLPTRANKLSNIALKRKLRKGGMSRRQEAFLRGLVAANDGDKYVFIKGSRSGFDNAGIYRVWGRRKRKGKYRGIKLKMAYSMRRAPTQLKPLATLGPAMDATEKKMPEFYVDALKYQIKHHGLFDGK